MGHLCKIILLCTFIITAAVATSSCGRYSSPVPVEGSGYPHRYPQYQGAEND